MKDDNKPVTEEEVVGMLMQYAAEGVSLKDIQGISEEAMEGMYAHAYHFYRQGKLDEAERYFSMLCMYDLNNPDFFTGLAAVHQLRGNYQKACDIYALAYIMADNDLAPMFYSGQCQLMQGNALKALQCFRLVIKESTDLKLKKKSRVYVDTILKNRPELQKSAEEKQHNQEQNNDE